MHDGSYKGSHMKLKDDKTLLCPYNVAVSQMGGSSTITNGKKRGGKHFELSVGIKQK